MFLEWWMIGLFVVASGYLHIRSYRDGFVKGWKGACSRMNALIEMDPAELAKMLRENSN